MANNSKNNAVTPGLKTLANCKPTEFLRQTVAIKKAAEDWVKATDIINIFRTPVNYKTIPEGATPEERISIIQENKKIQQDTGMERLSKLFDMAIEKNADKTLEIMALCCFIEPERVDDYPVKYYLNALMELVKDETVIGFFSSLTDLVQMNTGNV